MTELSDYHKGIVKELYRLAEILENMSDEEFNGPRERMAAKKVQAEFCNKMLDTEDCDGKYDHIFTENLEDILA